MFVKLHSFLRSHYIGVLGAMNLIGILAAVAVLADTVGRGGVAPLDSAGPSLVLGLVCLYALLRVAVVKEFSYPKGMVIWFHCAYLGAIAVSTLCVTARFILNT